MENLVFFEDLSPNHVEVIFLKEKGIKEDIADLITGLKNEDIKFLQKMGDRLDQSPLLIDDNFDFKNNYLIQTFFINFLCEKYGFLTSSSLLAQKLDLHLMPFNFSDMKCQELFFHYQDQSEINSLHSPEISDYEGNYLVIFDKTNSHKLINELIKDKSIDKNYLNLINQTDIVILMKLKD